jgi:D-beta-D-heptose 7-phosphate kinase/D-beta-D-heptose 1-phosphate adenosyltransferase
MTVSEPFGRAELLPIVERVAGVRVGCVGDIMLDRFVCGHVERISPEAPVPVLRIESETAMPGGAGNVVRNLSALGASVRFAAVVGDDPAGRELGERLGGQGGPLNVNLWVDAARRTTIKTRFLAGNQQLLRADEETSVPLSEAGRQQIRCAVAGWSADCPVLVLSDYAKGVFLSGLAEELIEWAIPARVQVVVDPKGPDFGRYRGARVVTPNRRELAAALGSALLPGDEAEAARVLRTRFGFGAVLVTLGADGMLLIDESDGVQALPTEAREVFDVSGAGDTVVATLAAALAAGAPLVQAAMLANAAAAIVVAKVGTAVARVGELARSLRRRDLLRAEEKVMPAEVAAERVEIWRRQGLRVGFTNGCFDLIHPGHVSLLRQARAACDRLVVGLNSDGSVARLKGPGRPAQQETARAAVLASMEGVDAVVIFAEDTPAALIERLRPDVLAKGADYRLDQIVGADFVRSYGGRVLLARLEPGHSTTATIETLARS